MNYTHNRKKTFVIELPDHEFKGVGQQLMWLNRVGLACKELSEYITNNVKDFSRVELHLEHKNVGDKNVPAGMRFLFKL